MDTHFTVIETTSNNRLATIVRDALNAAIRNEGQLGDEILALTGMSGRKYRLFINNLVRSTPEPRYLEVGVWQGSTLCAAIAGNQVRALAIDNWAAGFGDPADKFFTNLSRFKGNASVSFIDSDFREVNFSALGKFNIYFFDGPHEERDQFDGVSLAQPALDDQFVLIVDDWNWAAVRNGTGRGLASAGLRVDFAAEIRTTLNGTLPANNGAPSDWHNGYFIAACSKTLA